MEKIGKVSLDDTNYPGRDLYSDGKVEDRILEMVKKYQEKDFHQLIAREKDWAVMYHLAHGRENILSWYPFTEGAKVLEIGSGCGAVTGAVSEKAGSVTCIDLSKKRSTINAIRHQDSSNLKICLGNFQDVEKGLDRDFDYATLIGVFEYGKGYIGGKRPYHEFLTTVMEHIRPGGKLLIAIENKFGLKYWAGCREDHVGTYFEGLEGYQHDRGVRTFSKPELIRIMEECGYRQYQFYYPYPDYKFPTVIYSDEHLPKIGELNQNLCNFDRNRLLLMDEGKVYDQILKDELFPLYSNSFFIEITKDSGESAEAVQQPEEQVLYTRYSNGRAPKYSIQTRIVRNTEGKRILYKKAEYPSGQTHIAHIAEAKQRLESLWQEKGQLCVNNCTLQADRIEFEYLEGITLEEELDGLLEQGEIAQAAEKIREAAEKIQKSFEPESFCITEDFRHVFGITGHFPEDQKELSDEIELLPNEPAISTADIDMIFSNLLQTADGNWHVLDYEWTFFFPIPVSFLLYRAIYYYLEGASSRKVLKEQFDFYGEFGITPGRRKLYKYMEQQFQYYIAGSSVSPGMLYQIMGKKAFSVGELFSEADQRRIQVYLDHGQGFSEEDSYFIETGYNEDIHCTVTIPENVVGVWIDPALRACMIRDLKMDWIEEVSEKAVREKDADGEPVAYRTTGFELEKNCYLFDNSDPKIILEEIPQGKRQIRISYHISILEEETAALLMDKVNTKGRMKKKVRELIKG